MFNLFKEKPHDVKWIRNSLLQSIKEKMQLAQGGEGANIMAVYIFIGCHESEKHLYEAAVYTNVPGKFKIEEIQKIADDYAISLSASFTVEVSFTEQFPSQAERVKDMNAAVFISTKKSGLVDKKKKGFIKILNGEAEQPTYFIDPSHGRVNIGREASAQAIGNYMRKNAIAFKPVEHNRAISRQHAHIEWESDSNSFLVFADAGSTLR